MTRSILGSRAPSLILIRAARGRKGADTGPLLVWTTATKLAHRSTLVCQNCPQEKIILPFN